MKIPKKKFNDFADYALNGKMIKIFGGGGDDPTEGDEKKKLPPPPPPKTPGPFGPIIKS